MSSGSSLFAVLLAGVVAINVAVLRLNLQLDEDRSRTHRSQERHRAAPLRDLQRGRDRRIERLAKGELGLARGRARGHDLRPARAVKAAATNRRIALLAAGFLVLLGAALARAVVDPGREGARNTRRWRFGSIARPSSSRRTRGTIVDRNGEPLAIGRLATTVYANPRQVDDARDLTLAAAKQLRPRPGDPLPDARRPLARVRLRRAEGRSAQGEEPPGVSTSRASASTRRSSATTRKALSRRRCSATRVSTTRASRGSSARSRERSRASPGARRS